MMYKRLIPMAVMLTLALGNSSCDNSDAPDLPPTSPTIEMSRAETIINESHNRWGVSLFNAASQSVAGSMENENFAISPLSLSLTLSMCANTFDDDFASAICRQFDSDGLTELNELNRKLMMYLPDKTNKCELYLSNAIWHTNELTATERYRSDISNYYFGHIEGADFNRAEAVADRINAWTSQSTRGLINKVASPDVVNHANIILSNALYFKSRWDEIFDADKTKAGEFRNGNAVSTADFMNDSRALRYFESDGLQATEIKYAGSYSLLCVLPPAGTDICTFAQEFDYDRFKETITGMKPYLVDIRLPKFNISQEFNCSNILNDMGLDINPKNYEGLTGSDAPMDFGMLITQFVKMKTDEIGSEAAAVTIVADSISPGLAGHVSVSFDRPFIFFIRNTTTGSIIMAGTVVKP